MHDREHALLDATMRFYTQLDEPDAVGIDAFVQTVAPELRDELAAFLDETITMDEPDDTTPLTPEEQALLDHGNRYFHQQLQRYLFTPPPSLTALRKLRGLTVAALARLVELPVDLLARIERGGVRAATMPERLLERMAVALAVTADELQRSLATAHATGAAVRLHASDGTSTQPDDVLDFADALARSSATATQRQMWS